MAAKARLEGVVRGGARARKKVLARLWFCGHALQQTLAPLSIFLLHGEIHWRYVVECSHLWEQMKWLRILAGCGHL